MKRIFCLTSATPPDEPQIVEFGDLVLHHRGAVPQFRAVILVVAGPHRHHGAVADVAQRNHLEGDRQRLVAAPVRRQYRAHHVRTPRAYQFARVFREETVDGPFG